MHFSRLVYTAALGCLSTAIFAQKAPKVTTGPSSLPEYRIQAAEPEAHVRFLASDEMLGRRTGEQTNLIAARYIAEQLRKIGAKPPAGQDDYLLPVAIESRSPENKGWLIHGTDTLRITQDFISVSGSGGRDLPATAVVSAGYGMDDDYKNLDVKGKIVLVQFGTPDSRSPNDGFTASKAKRERAAAAGAVALIETLPPAIPWNLVTQYFGGSRVSLKSEVAENTPLTHLWVGGTALNKFRPQAVTSLAGYLPGQQVKALRAMNVAGVIEGSDPRLKAEYVILSAHFDHIGTGKNGGGNFTEADSIFNGTRDNAFGTANILVAARALAEVRPRRSVLVLGFTGEEMGLLGSHYYAEHPVVPLEKCVFNLNNDGAGYNDTTLVTTFGGIRTGALKHIQAGAAAFGLKVNEDPAPEQNLFDRSDNVSFAAKGIPAPTWSPGFTAFDDRIFKYYHQVTDNPNTISYSYLKRFCQAYAHAARLIANDTARPQWAKGDKYEAAGLKLYGTGK